MKRFEYSKIEKERFDALAIEILDMAKKDQELRLSGNEKDNEDAEWRQEYRNLDATNTKRLKEIIGEIGWPVISKVGEEASHAAWLLVQHARDENLNIDIGFQKQALELMKEAQEGDVDKSNIAYLEDRILISQDKHQLYGTQQELKDGKWTPMQTADIEKVNERRKEMGMPPVEEATEKLNESPKSSLK
ncbi:MAG: DUF6624 domain-containing protein [Candidatus Spechtbacterales bacterium]